MTPWSTINHALTQSWGVYWNLRLAGKIAEAELVKHSILVFTKAVRT